ncbi:hypothetical protein EDC96DRAFT_544847 [Choanephora cucurbitarum]|nr:hypothetical protein EDC96DRAFT_544847 [Choanephora cucurbitarum]
MSLSLHKDNNFWLLSMYICLRAKLICLEKLHHNFKRKVISSSLLRSCALKQSVPTKLVLEMKQSVLLRVTSFNLKAYLGKTATIILRIFWRKHLLGQMQGSIPRRPYIVDFFCIAKKDTNATTLEHSSYVLNRKKTPWLFSDEGQVKATNQHRSTLRLCWSAAQLRCGSQKISYAIEIETKNN